MSNVECDGTSCNTPATDGQGTSPAAIQPPTAEEIERLFRRLPVAMARPVLLGSLEMLKACCRFNWEVAGLHNLSGFEPPYIFASNHCSHADTAAILGVLPKGMRNHTCVAAALDVFGHSGDRKRLSKGILQFLVGASFRAFAFDRQGPPLRSVRTCVQLIRNGWNLLLYPEGTRSRTGAMNPFKGGVGVLARFTKRPVVPIYVNGGINILPYGAFMPRPGHMSVTVGKPLVFEKSDTPASFTTRLQESVCALGGVPVVRPHALEVAIADL
ncbi:MAG TPA: lysophospholipid acyltransferase family protein [Phycisphaerales bacterium]|nr:lysophospholipid acyltransferase family protein [Phycisphaerales bacterium]